MPVTAAIGEFHYRLVEDALKRCGFDVAPEALSATLNAVLADRVSAAPRAIPLHGPPQASATVGRTHQASIIRLRVEPPIDQVPAVRAVMDLFSQDKDLEARAQAAGTAEFQALLSPLGLTVEELATREIDRHLAPKLMEIFTRTLDDGIRQAVLEQLKTVTDRSIRKELVPWLLDQFSRPVNDVLGWEMGFFVMDRVTLHGAEKIIPLVNDPVYASNRVPLCCALAKSKHPQAQQVFAALLPTKLERDVLISVLDGLAKLEAKECLPAVQSLNATIDDPELRGVVERTLRRLGGVRSTPRHLVKHVTPPGDLVEWSANLDASELHSVLTILAGGIDHGFTTAEINEVCDHVHDIAVGATAVFKFAIQSSGAPSFLWLELYKGDEGSPDVAVFAVPELIKRLDKK